MLLVAAATRSAVDPPTPDRAIYAGVSFNTATATTVALAKPNLPRPATADQQRSRLQLGDASWGISHSM